MRVVKIQATWVPNAEKMSVVKWEGEYEKSEIHRLKKLKGAYEAPKGGLSGSLQRFFNKVEFK